MDASDTSSVFLFGDYRFDRRAGGLFRRTSDGTSISVTLGSRALDILGILLEQHGHVVTRAEIKDAVWCGIVVEDANLAVQISALRRILDQDRETGSGWIQTVSGRGYRFTGAVTRLDTACVVAPVVPDVGRDLEDTPQITGSGSVWRVGRTAPLRTLDGLLQRALAGERQVVFVTGEAGIGKTTLLDMALARVSPDDASVLRGHCTELFGSGEAFLPLIEALQTACHGMHGSLLLKMLRDHAPTWLVQMPAFLDATDRIAFQNEIFGATRERMLREFCELVEALSVIRPLILILEDLHWSDGATLDVLSRFARRDRKAAVLVLATYRPSDVLDAGSQVRAVHQDLQIHGRCSELTLDRLSLTDIKQYLALRFGGSTLPETLSREVFRRTRGHPLFAVSLIDFFVSQKTITNNGQVWRLASEDAVFQKGLPREVGDMLTRQINRLSAGEQTLLEIASAAGAEFSAAAIAGAANRLVLDVEQALDALARKGQILTMAGLVEWPDGTISGQYSFQHALYQEILYQRLAPAQRVRTHLRLGQTLEAGHDGQTSDIASVLALHFGEGHDFTKAIHYFGLAAWNSARRFANLEAVTYLTRALGFVDRLPAANRCMTTISLLQQRAWVRLSADDMTGSIADFNSMITSAAEAEQVRMEVIGLVSLSRVRLYSDRRQCLQTAARAVARSEDLEEDDFKALVHGNAASLNLTLKGWNREDADICRHAVEATAHLRDPDLLMRRYGIECVLKYLGSDYNECCRATKHGRDLARRSGNPYLFALFNSIEAVALLHLGDWREARRSSAAALSLGEKNANPAAQAICRFAIAWLHAEAFDFNGARQICEATPVVSVGKDALSFFFRESLLAKAYIGLRDYEAAWRRFDLINHQIEVEGYNIDSIIHAELLYCICEYRLATGDLIKARAEAERFHAFAASAPDRNYLGLAHRLLSIIAIAAGNVDEAEAHLSEAIAIVESTNLPPTAWRVYLTASKFHARSGNNTRASEYLERSRYFIGLLAGNFDPDDPLRASLLAGFAAESTSLSAQAPTRPPRTTRNEQISGSR